MAEETKDEANALVAFEQKSDNSLSKKVKFRNSYHCLVEGCDLAIVKYMP